MRVPMNDSADRPTARHPTFPGLSRVEPLGSGAMSFVFRAWQDDLGREVAVKMPRPETSADPRLVEQFEREARILARLDHPGIVPVYFSGVTPAGPFYVMRLVDGVAIDRCLGGQPADAIAAVFRAVSTALATAHRAGVLHRDVKPDNVLVESSGRAVLVDFGLATRAVPGEVDATQPELVGTIDYLAPELLTGAPYSPATDVYALGGTLYKTLTGRVPFPGDDLHDKLHAIRQDDPALPRLLRPDVPASLQAICLKALERAPADRYASAEEMGADLERFLRGDVVLAHPTRSRRMLRKKVELHLRDLADWQEQGLLGEAQRADLQHAYERVDERGRGLLTGVLTLPNLLLLAGILLCVFGPVVLQLVTWDNQESGMRVGLPAAPAALLLAVGIGRWRALDRRRAVACLLGATLLMAPLGFALADLVPPLRSIVDSAGRPHWLTLDEFADTTISSPAWMQRGLLLLRWKLLITAVACLAPALAFYHLTHAAAFLWLVCVAGLGATVDMAQIAGWDQWPLAVQWLLGNALGLALLGLGLRFDRLFQRERALPFYGFGCIALVIAALGFAFQGIPARWLGGSDRHLAIADAHVVHGLAFAAAGVFLHRRGSSLFRSVALAALHFGLLQTLFGLALLTAARSLGHELLLIGGCIGYLVLGLALQLNSIVLLSALILPIALGTVSQRHVESLWAWSASVVLGGALLVGLSFSLRNPRQSARPHGAPRPRAQ